MQLTTMAAAAAAANDQFQHNEENYRQQGCQIDKYIL
jgi:hypothetical protein